MTLLNIITDCGSTFVGSTSTVYKRHGDFYIPIDAISVNVGDKVIYEKDWISRRSLEEIDLVLEARSDAYRNARNVLFERNDQGLYIPRLRTMLIRGIGPSSDTLENKVLRNNADFSPSEYRVMVDLAHGVVKQYAKEKDIQAPAWNTIANWIRGEVIAPEETRFLEALLAINPLFNSVYRSFQEGGEFKDAYVYFVSRRRGLMAYIANIKNKGSIRDAAHQWSPIRKGGLAEEISIILQEFGADVDSQYIDAQIKSIERVHKKNESRLSARRNTEPHLFRGIYTKEEPPQNKKIKSIDDVDISEVFWRHSPFNDPDAYLRTVKEFSLEYGVTLKQLRSLVDTHLNAVIREYKEVLEKTYTEGGFTRPELLREQMRIFEEATGVKYEEIPKERLSGWHVISDRKIRRQMSRIDHSKQDALDELGRKKARILHSLEQ